MYCSISVSNSYIWYWVWYAVESFGIKCDSEVGTALSKKLTKTNNYYCLLCHVCSIAVCEAWIRSVRNVSTRIKLIYCSSIVIYTVRWLYTRTVLSSSNLFDRTLRSNAQRRRAQRRIKAREKAACMQNKPKRKQRLYASAYLMQLRRPSDVHTRIFPSLPSVV